MQLIYRGNIPKEGIERIEEILRLFSFVGTQEIGIRKYEIENDVLTLHIAHSDHFNDFSSYSINLNTGITRSLLIPYGLENMFAAIGQVLSFYGAAKIEGGLQELREPELSDLYFDMLEYEIKAVNKGSK